VAENVSTVRALAGARVVMAKGPPCRELYNQEVI
jgi:hypothetical protein